MTKPTSARHTYHHRHITVDGLSYSLENGQAIKSDTHSSTKKSKKTVHSRIKPQSTTKQPPSVLKPHTSESNQLPIASSMHPHGVSHPSLPLLHSPHHETGIHTIGRVMKHSFREYHDRVAIDASLIATVLSPVFWLLAALPWILLTWINPAQLAASRLIAVASNFDQSAPIIQLGLVGFIGCVALTVWIIRHIYQLVSYAAHMRHIDNRPLDSSAIIWQGIAKIGRLITIIVLDLGVFVFTLGVSVGLILLILNSQLPSFILIPWLIVTLILSAILTIHRPLTRVMLAITNQPAHKIVGLGFKIIIRSYRRALAFGLIWMAIAGLTAISVGAIIWATLSYSQILSSNPASVRVGLTLLSTLLIYGVVVGFTIWSQGYWALAYHHLAHHSYPAAVSRLIVTELHPKTRRIAIIHLGLTVIIGSSLLIVGYTLFKTPIQQSANSVPGVLQKLTGARK